MTATEDLARQLVEHPRWEWRPRMLSRRWAPGFSDHLSAPVTATADLIRKGWFDTDGAAFSDVPDLDDPATQGVLLGMLREACTSVDVSWDDEDGWCLRVEWSGEDSPRHHPDENGWTPAGVDLKGAELGKLLARALPAAWGEA